MNKEFVTYKQALALAKLNFNEKCFGYYGIENELKIEISSNLDTNLTRRDFYAAPTFSQAFRWFREKYELEGVVQHANDYTWYKFSIYQKSNFYTSEGWKVLKSQGLEYKTYEEAESACLDKIIEIIKNEKS